MTEVVCPGWRASWINAWLAGVGATVLDERIRLSWTTDGEPVAVLSCEGIDPVEALVESWPTEETLSRLPIAEEWEGSLKLQRKVPVEAFIERAQVARSDARAWALSSTMTDLSVDKQGEVAHAPFDPAGPGTIKWLHHRLLKVHQHLDKPAKQLRGSAHGQSERVKDNGLGFDQTRLGSLEDKTDPWVDAVVETLAFFGLAILPMRGEGADERLGRSATMFARQRRQRGWRQIAGAKERHFCWPAWNQPLDADGVDALLDAWNPERKQSWARLGVHAGWRTEPYEARGSSDSTRAFGSKRL